MRLLIVADEIEHWGAGTEKQLRLMMEHFPAVGIATELLVIHGTSALEDAPFTVRVLGWQNKRYLAPFIVAALRRAMRRSHPDAVMTFFPSACWLAMRAAAAERIPVRITTRRNFGTTNLRWIERGLPAWSRYATHILCNTPRLVEHVRRSERPGALPVDSLPNLVIPRPVLRQREPAELAVGLVANLRAVKCVDVFVRAAAMLADEFPRASFAVAGDGPLRAELETLAANLGLAGRLTFCGRITAVPEFLDRLSVGVLTSDSEGSSNAILEYMESGLPVVATDAGGNPDLVRDGENGLLFPPGDHARLAECLRVLGRDAALRMRMGVASRSIIASELALPVVLPRYREYLARALAVGARA